MTDTLELDYETFNGVKDLKTHGLDQYSKDAEVMLMAYRFNGGPMNLWDYSEGRPFPRDVREALVDPHVKKWAFNAQFERIITTEALLIPTPVQGWRCSMVLAYMQSFTGGLADIGRQMSLSEDHAKMESEGRRLVRMFCMPQKPSKKQPHVRRTHETDPDDWETFREYCKRDVVAEGAIRRPLLRFPILEAEWELYEIDQIINDRGKPVNVTFVRNALWMADERRKELLDEMRELTGLENPNSSAQLLGWLKRNGYSFNDVGKDTITKSLREDPLTEDGRKAMLLRQWAARMSVKKHDALLKAVGDDGNMRFLYQFAGASRTNRWAGRRVQTQNLPRTPKIIENDFSLEFATDLITQGDYVRLKREFEEPMEIVVGTVRSAFQAPEGYEFTVCDLSSIESVSIGYLAGCERILNVFRSGLDVYKDFGSVWLRKPYEEITKQERNWSKPAMLGAGYGLSGGEIGDDGKKTGLWGYGEAMGIFMEREQAHGSVKVFREDYAHEVVDLWADYENAARFALTSGRSRKIGHVEFEYRKPYLMIRLPSGRRMFYYKPRIESVTVRPKNREPFTRKTLTYMGVSQVTKKWQRVPTHGAKLVENLVQAFARDVLAVGMRRAHEAGFNLRGHVHDELIALRREGDPGYSWERLRECMTAPIKWAPGLPLGGAGWHGAFYKKD